MMEVFNNTTGVTKLQDVVEEVSVEDNCLQVTCPSYTVSFGKQETVLIVKEIMKTCLSKSTMPKSMSDRLLSMLGGSN